ncbi:MAG TPA: hypothetical protein VGD83_11120, partial [Streptosporangiaceae bacterium]
GWDLMRRLASGGAVPGLTGRGCTFTAPVPGRLAAAGRQAHGRWCRTGTGASHSPEVAAAVCGDVAAKLSPVVVVLVKSA